MVVCYSTARRHARFARLRYRHITCDVVIVTRLLMVRRRSRKNIGEEIVRTSLMIVGCRNIVTKVITGELLHVITVNTLARLVTFENNTSHVYHANILFINVWRVTAAPR